jgi:hypothetical protein
MTRSTLIKNNLSHYWRTNIAVILGVATAVAVLTGALLVGDSVRGSLRDLALSRLGKTDLIVTAPGFFRELLADDLKAHQQFAANFHGVCPIIALEGVVTRDENNARAGAVQVYGVDERFWEFHGIKQHSPEENEVLLSQFLAQELAAKAGDTVILRIEKSSAIPAESLHSRKEELGVTIRFLTREVLPASSLGEFSLQPQQGSVRAIFVPLRKLQRNLDQEGKANVILLSAKNAESSSSQVAAQILKDKFALADLGVKLRVLEEQDAVSLETESAVISGVLEEKARETARKLVLQSRSFLTYLANTIRFGDKEIPYSLVAADSILDSIDPSLKSTEKFWIFLNDWAARNLRV